MASPFILYAPNIHTGGGLVLLRLLLEVWPIGIKLIAFLDIRTINSLLPPSGSRVIWVNPTLSSRFNAELKLFKMSRPSDLILCFHGLPPIFRASGRVVLFQQNRLLLELIKLNYLPINVRLRLSVERWISHTFKRNVDEYFVQTPSMARLLANWHGSSPQITIFPFYRTLKEKPLQEVMWDFIYVSDGLPHKNHMRLFKAWELLAIEGIRPSLILTLGPRDDRLSNKISDLAKTLDIKIINFGILDHDEILKLYCKSRALIFPSLIESYGLPLVEARQFGLPIIASELDYVRDICEPLHTFDPYSPVSISRAVKRFLHHDEILQFPNSAANFLKKIGIVLT